MPRFEKKGQEPERVPAAEEIQASADTHDGMVPLIAPPGVTSVSGCQLEGRLCWTPPEIAVQLITMHGFERPSG